MAANTNKRVAVKHIRDGIKSNYVKGSKCEVCGTTHDLEFHHYTTVSLLLKKYAKEHNLDISSDRAVLDMRDQFYKDHWFELVDDAATLCNKHHVQLHNIYGQQPLLSSVDKQKRWVKRMKAKADGIVLPNEEGRFQSGGIKFTGFLSAIPQDLRSS